MERIQTFHSDNNGATCLICSTTYHTGTPIWPQPSCECGNIEFFDITPQYVRIGITWFYIKHPTLKNWNKEILEQIKTEGKPTYTERYTESEETLKKDINFFNDLFK